MTKDKNQIVADIADRLQRAQGVFLVDFTGLNVAEETDLRGQLGDLEVEYRVVKNTLALRAVALAKFPIDETLFRGPTALALSYDDPLQPAKVLAAFQKKLDKPRIKAAVIEGQLYDAEAALQFAAIPSKQELLAKMVGSLQSPVSGFVRTLQAVLREIVGVLDAVREKQQSESE